jgi:hypothetical protein
VNLAVEGDLVFALEKARCSDPMTSTPSVTSALPMPNRTGANILRGAANDAQRLRPGFSRRSLRPRKVCGAKATARTVQRLQRVPGRNRCFPPN